MKTYTIYILISFLLISPIAVSSEKITVNSEQSLSVDYSEFNKTILSARAGNEDWVSDPVLISLKFTGPFEGRKQSIERVNENPESNKVVQVTIINDGLLDDSVKAEKFVVDMSNENDAWQITGAVKTVQCYKGRGHEDFSAEPCR